MKAQDLLERLAHVDGWEPAPERRRGRRLRRIVAVATGVLVAAGAFVLVQHESGSGDDADQTASASTSLATVSRRTLREQEKVDGSLGYGKARPVANSLQGKITWIAPEGSTVQQGQTLYRVDEMPVVLLYGDVPAYRRMARGIDDGADVGQLEANLKALGFADGLIDTPDNHFDAATQAAVKRWEKSLGLTQDGVVEVGEVVFLPGAQRVGTHRANVGSDARPGQDVVETTGTTRVVTVELDARKQSIVKKGDKVDIELPGGKVISGTVADVGKVAKTSGGSGSGSASGGGSGAGGAGSSSTKATVTVTITVDDQQAAGDLEGAPVKVQFTRSSKEGVLAVPVNALLALPDGGYGVEVDQNGLRRVVKVETGLFSSGYVEVSGEGISEGTKVVVPS